MSLSLDREGTHPKGVEVVSQWDGLVHIGVNAWPNAGLSIRPEDFLDAAYYVLTNTDLKPDDYRLTFIEAVKRLKPVPGWNIDREPDAQRLSEGKGNEK